MTDTLGLILRQAEMVGCQIHRAVDGITEGQADHRFASDSMSIRQSLIHLADNYAALCAELSGEGYSFGSWHPSDDRLATLVREWEELRGRALQTAKTRFEGSDLDENVTASFATWPAWKLLSEWIVAHDAYHLGQICALRLAQDPAWDMFSVYDANAQSG